MEKLKNRQTVKSNIKTLIGASAICATITLIGSGICAGMILKGMIPERYTGYCVMLILLLASTLGAMIAGINNKVKKPQRILLNCVLYEGALLILTAVLFGGNYRGIGVTSIIIFSGGALAAICTNRNTKGRKRHGFKIRSC